MRTLRTRLGKDNSVKSRVRSLGKARRRISGRTKGALALFLLGGVSIVTLIRLARRPCPARGIEELDAKTVLSEQ